MGIKMSGKDFKEFYDDPAVWEEEAFHEDAVILVDGEEFISEEADGDAATIADSAVVQIEDGCIIYASKADADLVSTARKWLKARTTVSIVVEVDKDKKDALIAAIKAAGGRLVK